MLVNNMRPFTKGLVSDLLCDLFPRAQSGFPVVTLRCDPLKTAVRGEGGLKSADRLQSLHTVKKRRYVTFSLVFETV